MQAKWQVSLRGQVYEADAESLKSWILEGRVRPEDLVCKAGLNWIEAGRVPELRPVLERLYPAPAVEVADRRNEGLHRIYTVEMAEVVLRARCMEHPERLVSHICTSCAQSFCKECRKTVGTASQPICQACDAICHPYEEAVRRIRLLLDRHRPFGIGDLQAALKYPAGFVTQMLMVSMLYGALTAFGFLGFPPATFLANAILFLCTSTVIRQVLSAETDKPDFALGDILVDPLHHALIGLGVALVTTGPHDLMQLIYALKDGSVMGIVFSRYKSYFAPEVNLFTVLAMLWALFYYPIALIVAGLTDSFLAVVNPLEGYRAIRALGNLFPRLFIYYLSIALGFGIPFGIIALLVAPLLVAVLAAAVMIPLVNVPIILLIATVLALPLLYLNFSVAYLLGRALFKRPEEFGWYEKP